MIYPELDNQPSLWQREPLLAAFLYGLFGVLVAALLLSLGLIGAAILGPHL